MGLFSRKEKEVKPLELTQEQKDRYMMDILNLFLDAPLKGSFSRNTKEWDADLTEEQLVVLNDPRYSSIKVSIDQFSDLYKKVVDIQKEFEANSDLIKANDIEINDFFWGSYHLLEAFQFEVQSEINGLDDFAAVYNEIIIKEMKKIYNQAKCMEVLINNDIDQYDSYLESLYYNNINKYTYLSPASEKVAKKQKVLSSVLIWDYMDIKKGLKVANEHARNIKDKENIKNQERIRKMNQEMNKAMFSSVRKAEEISQMLEDSKRYKDDDIFNNKTK